MQSPGGCPTTPPGASPPGGSLPGIPPRHRPHHGGWRRSEGNPYTTHPRTRSTKREDHPWADCRVVCGIRKTLCGEKKNHEVIRESGYLRSRQGLGPWRPVLIVVTGFGGTVRGKSFSPLGPFVLPCWGGLPFLPSPRWGRGFLLLLLALVGRVGLGFIIRQHLKTGTLPSPRGLLLGLLLRHHVGCRSQQPVKRASAGASGNGAGEIAYAAFFNQSCQRTGSLDPA